MFRMDRAGVYWLYDGVGDFNCSSPSAIGYDFLISFSMIPCADT